MAEMGDGLHIKGLVKEIRKIGAKFPTIIDK